MGYIGDLIVHAPNRIGAQRLHSTISRVDGVKLDAKDKQHLGINSVNMNTVAHSAEDTSGGLETLGDLVKIIRSELPQGMARVGFDHNWKLHLAFELVKLGCILGLGKGEVIARDVVDAESVLLKNVLCFGGIMKVVVAKVDATSVDGNTVGEASILRRCQD